MDKNKIIEACFDILDQKISQVKQAIHDSNTSLKEDTKSSAGDKYETSREMIQQDLNRYESQLHILNMDVELLKRISTLKEKMDTVVLGSLVFTDKTIYFLATSIGQVKIDDKIVFSISSISPIGKLLLGKTIGETFEFNGVKQIVESII